MGFFDAAQHLHSWEVPFFGAQGSIIPTTQKNDVASENGLCSAKPFPIVELA